MLAEAARISTERLSADDNDAPFYQAKLASARFYSAQVLPRSAALAEIIIGGSQTTASLEQAHFELA